jgi:hypothetical protein
LFQLKRILLQIRNLPLKINLQIDFLRLFLNWRLHRLWRRSELINVFVELWGVKRHGWVLVLFCNILLCDLLVNILRFFGFGLADIILVTLVVNLVIFSLVIYILILNLIRLNLVCLTILISLSLIWLVSL